MSKILGVHIPAQMRNLAINGAFDFWQQNAGNTVTVNTATTQNAYSSDMWAYYSGGATTKNYSLQRSTDVPSTAQSGFAAQYSNMFTMITGIASPGASDYILPFDYLMEGKDYAKIHGKVVTFGFWVKASVIGNYNFSLRNQSNTRTYVTTFPITGSNTWEYKSITVQLDTAGTWTFDNGLALYAEIGAYGGSTFQTGTVNQWQAGATFVATTSTNWMATSGATLRVDMFSITEGALGVGPLGFARCADDIQAELAMCLRYYETGGHSVSNVGSASGTVGGMAIVRYLVEKRAIPTVSIFGPSNTPNTVRNDNNGATEGTITVGSSSALQHGARSTSALSSGIQYGYNWIADARL